MSGSGSLSQGYSISNTLIRPNVIKNQTKKKHSRASGSLLSGRLPSSYSKLNLSAHSVLLPNKFLQNNLSLVTTKLTQEVGSAVTTKMSYCNSLPTDLASQLSKKFHLDGHSELQVEVNSPSSSYPLQLDFNIANSSGPMILHWGGIREGQREWILPSHHPDKTNKYKNKAFQTRFETLGSNSSLKIEIDEPEIEALEFLILDEARNKWLKNNGQNFRILMPWMDKPSLSSSVHIKQSISPPEDLVQIQAYLEWERKGKKNYTPSEEKEEYEIARSELQLELDKGTSVEELRAILTKNKKDTEEPHKEKKHLIDNTLDVHKPQNRMKENIHRNISKHLENKKHFTKERIHRKKWDLMQLLKKYPFDAVEEEKPLLPKVMTTLDLFTEAKLQHDDVFLLNKKTFKIGNKELLVLVTYSHGKTTVCLVTDQNGPLVLHWALSRNPGEWMLPPTSVLPLNTISLKQACETPFSHKYSEDPFSQVQSVEIEMPACDFSGMPFVIRTNGHWIKNDGLDFYTELVSEVIKERKDVGDGVGTAKSFLEKIAETECEAERSFMHRFNIASDLVGKAKEAGKLGFIGLLVWMRFMATRQLTWNKNYNVKPREISKAQDRLTDLLQDVYERYPQYREISRLILSTVGRGGEGDVGQRIRDEILVIQRSNECKGGMMEEWHQKLHNNTSPDDVVICQALIDYIKNNFDINVYWNTLMSNGITKERLLSYDRAIHSEPNFRSDQKDGLLHDLENYLRTLKAVHSGADLESSIATCMGYKAEGQGFMVGVQINPIRGLPSGFPDLLKFIVEHIEDKEVEPLLEGLIEAREELQPILQNSHERLKDLIFLDIALDSTVRTSIEREYGELHNASPERIMYFISLVLENLIISSDDNEDLIYCLKGWYTAIEMVKNNDDHWALFAKSLLDRTQLTLSNRAEHYEQILQPSAEYLGLLLGVDQWAVSIFTEEIIRAGSAAPLSALLNRLDPTLRKVANLGSWQIISPVEVSGYIVTVDELLSVQHKSYEKPTILIAKTVKGEEEIPDGTVAVLTPSMPDVLSHVSVRARNCKICFATCFESEILKDFQENEGKLFRLKPTSADIIYGEIKECELSNGNSKEERPASSINLVRKKFLGKYAISSQEFTDDMVGAKSRNTAYLTGKVPSSIGIPTSVALPFGVFENVLSDKSNKAVEYELKSLVKRLDHEDFGVLSEIRTKVLQLTAPSQLVFELKKKMKESGMPWPGDEGEHRWEQAWLAIKKVWASKWNDRAYFSTKKAKLDHNYLSMAVLVQEIISADYAFVIHTTNPASGNSSVIYTEMVKGLGETLVGAYPGRALSFVCNKSDLDSPKVLGYPSKPIALFIRPSIIFRSDSNGEDLEGYAGAGLYDSVPMDKEDEVIVDYSTDPVIMDLNFRQSILSRIARTGYEIEKLYGSPQDIEGVVKDGKITVVQTRPQM